MFGAFKNKSVTSIDTLIGTSTVIRGDVIYSGGMRIDGEVFGNVRCTGNGHGSRLVISEKGCVHGCIDATHVVINGRVEGPVLAREFVELQSNAQVVGDISYRNIELHLGAVIQGTMQHWEEGEAVKHGQDRQAQDQRNQKKPLTSLPTGSSNAASGASSSANSANSAAANSSPAVMDMSKTASAAAAALAASPHSKQPFLDEDGSAGGKKLKMAGK